ncbi:unnamed protein product [Linum trigynum]|uniref:F-box associated beta-propeller type 1 domain-containing protein n=1 Tax=Linum trigynum TaxID=586398 RepID=A0AAV2D672_9ROSI
MHYIQPSQPLLFDPSSIFHNSKVTLPFRSRHTPDPVNNPPKQIRDLENVGPHSLWSRQRYSGPPSPWELGKLRCVNKEWRSIIDDPDFIQGQHRRFTSLFFSWWGEAVVLRSRPGTFGPGGVPLPLTYFVDHIIMGSYHGLLCLGDYQYQLLLFNPAFPEEMRLVTLLDFMRAEPSLGYLFENGSFQSDLVHWKAYGFGYDKVASDYKAVVLLLVKECDRGKVYILTYQFGTKSFRCLQVNKFLHQLYRQRLGVLLSGALHWITGGFEFNSDVSDSITEFRQPDYSGDKEGSLSCFKSVGVVDSCLSVFATFIGSDGLMFG